jgi:hypothetical protein
MVTWVDTMGTMQRGKQAIACAPEGQYLPFWGARGQAPPFPACVRLGGSRTIGSQARPGTWTTAKPWAAHTRVSAVTTRVEAWVFVLE